MKQRKTAVALLLLLALLLTACGAGQSESAKAVPAARTSARASLSEGVYYQTLAAMGERPLTGATDNLFSAKFEGDKVSGTAELADGMYRFTADRTDGEAWHVKLECNYHTTPGRDYRVSYHFHSDVAGMVKFGDHQEFDIVAGNNTVVGLLTASSDVTYLDLQLGALPPLRPRFQLHPGGGAGRYGGVYRRDAQGLPL